MTPNLAHMITSWIRTPMQSFIKKIDYHDTRWQYEPFTSLGDGYFGLRLQSSIIYLYYASGPYHSKIDNNKKK